MRKKRNPLNVSHLFVLKHSTSPKLFQKSPGSSFSEAVSGFNVGTDGYKNNWPELNSDVKFTHYRDRKETSDENGSTSFDQLSNDAANEPYNLLAEGKLLQQGLSCNNSNFPCLGDFSDIRGATSDIKIASQFVQPSSIHDDSVILKTSFPKSLKPKKNDPIKIDIGSAIELGLSRKKKKEVKRLNQTRPRVLIPIASSGNALDSANPIREKGKVRLNQKKKLTALRKTMNRLKILPASERDIHGTLCKQLDELSLTTDDLEKLAKAKIHTSRFREYCWNFASKELVENVKELIIKLRGFQDRMHQKDEMKARVRRRYAIGFHECWKLLRAGNFKLLIIATNIERNEALFQKVSEFKTESLRQGVPIVFAGMCADLSFCVLKKNRTCVVGIISYDGANEVYSRIMSLFERDRVEYECRLSDVIGNEKNTPMPMEDVTEELRMNMLEKLRTD